MKQVLDNCVPRPQRDTYAVGWYYRCWPSLVHEFRWVNGEDANNDLDGDTSHARAEILLHRVVTLDAELSVVGKEALQRANERGGIVELPDLELESPIDTKYDFDGLDSLQCLVTYVMLRIILNRLNYHIILQRLPSESVANSDTEHRDLCKQCIPYLRGLGVLNSVLFAAPLYLSYEGACDQAEKDYLIDFALEGAASKERFPHPVDRAVVERFMLNTAKAATGRRIFDASLGLERH